MSLNSTPVAVRLHIGIFGRRNSGKSSLINSITGQKLAIVSDFPGTTGDPVYKTMEINPIGPVVFIDTAGFDDEGELGQLRVEKTREAVKKTDIAILTLDGSSLAGEELKLDLEKQWLDYLEGRNIPVIIVLNKGDLFFGKEKEYVKRASDYFAREVLAVCSKDGKGLDQLRDALASAREMQKSQDAETILGNLADQDDLVMLVMPQDKQAPKGRLILPQVQTIRELLDRRCTCVAATMEGFANALGALKESPKLIICDSQCVSQVYDMKPGDSVLTTFSILFARYKGDIEVFLDGVEALKRLKENSRVLIAEACTHAPLTEDIGREKIPALLRKKYGRNIEVQVVSGKDFPEDLTPYDLVIHCGGCMFNRKYMLDRIEQAKAQQVAITNYGMVMSYFGGILDKVNTSRR